MKECVQKVLLLTHGEDVDGITSAALLKLFFGEVEIIFVANKDQQKVFEDLFTSHLDLINTTVVVTDLVLKDFLLDSCDDKKSILERLIESCQRLIWIDHHSKVRQADLEKLGGEFLFGGDVNRCASKIVFGKFFAETNPSGIYDYANNLSLVAQVNDYPKTNAAQEIIKLGNELQRAITCLNYDNNIVGLKKLVGMIAANDNWQLWANESLEHYVPTLALAEAELLKSQQKISAGGFSFAATYVHPILPQKEVLRAMREEHKGKTDGCIAFFGAPVNNVMFFKDPIRNSFIAQDFCVFMKGGGRDGDGGYSLQFDLTPETFPRAIQEFMANIEKYLAPK